MRSPWCTHTRCTHYVCTHNFRTKQIQRFPFFFPFFAHFSCDKIFTFFVLTRRPNYINKYKFNNVGKEEKGKREKKSYLSLCCMEAGFHAECTQNSRCVYIFVIHFVLRQTSECLSRVCTSYCVYAVCPITCCTTHRPMYQLNETKRSFPRDCLVVVAVAPLPHLLYFIHTYSLARTHTHAFGPTTSTWAHGTVHNFSCWNSFSTVFNLLLYFLCVSQFYHCPLYHKYCQFIHAHTTHTHARTHIAQQLQ